MGGELAGRASSGQGSRLVECHSGYAYAERPVAIHWEGQRLEVERVEAEWRVSGGKRFRVRTRDGRLFDLLYGESDDEWRINPA